MKAENISVGFELRRLTNLVKREFEKQNFDNINKKFTPMHGMIIIYLFKNQDKDIFQKNIEKAFTIRRSTASNILRLMEDNELIKREPVSYDARLKKIILTDNAIEIQNEMIANRSTVEKKIKENISEEELEFFSKIILKMQGNLKN